MDGLVGEEEARPVSDGGVVVVEEDGQLPKSGVVRLSEERITFVRIVAMSDDDGRRPPIRFAMAVLGLIDVVRSALLVSSLLLPVLVVLSHIFEKLLLLVRPQIALPHQHPHPTMLLYQPHSPGNRLPHTKPAPIPQQTCSSRLTNAITRLSSTSLFMLLYSRFRKRPKRADTTCTSHDSSSA